MSTTQALLEAGAAHLYPNYRQPAFVLTRGRGCEVWDTDGRRYLDMMAGIAVSTLGHGHPRLVAALTAQVQELLHVSNYFYNDANVRLAERLCERTGMARALFCNSGTEAIEALLKMARRHFHAQGQTQRYRIIAFHNSFHGRTLGALTVTGQDKYRSGFGPLAGVTHVEYGSAAAVRDVMGDDVAGILVEPIQGEGGVIPAPPGFLAELRAICDEAGCLLLADEVQTGAGRTGRFLGMDHAGVKADVVALAKALGSGVPIGVVLCTAALAGALPPGSHGSTYAGNPLASRAALTTLEVMEAEDLVARAAEMGERLGERLRGLAERYPGKVAGERGQGLLRAIVFQPGVDAPALLGQLRDGGLLLAGAGPSALRFAPPLIVTATEIDEAITVLDRHLSGSASHR